MSHRRDPLFVEAVFYILLWYLEVPPGATCARGDVGSRAATLLLDMGEEGFQLYSSLLESPIEQERIKGVELCWQSGNRSETLLRQVAQIAEEDESVRCRFEASLRLAEYVPGAELAVCEIMLSSQEDYSLMYCRLIVSYRVVTRHIVDALLTLTLKHAKDSADWRRFMTEELSPYLTNYVRIQGDCTTVEYLTHYRKIKAYTYYNTVFEEYAKWLSYRTLWPGVVPHQEEARESLPDFGMTARRATGLGPPRMLLIAESNDKPINPYTGEPFRSRFVQEVFDLSEKRFRELVVVNGFE